MNTVYIKCTYYKASGKYYCDGEGRFDESLFEGCFYPKDYGKRLRELKMLPGVHTWKYYFTVYVCKTSHEIEKEYQDLVEGRIISPRYLKEERNKKIANFVEELDYDIYKHIFVYGEDNELEETLTKFREILYSE